MPAINWAEGQPAELARQFLESHSKQRSSLGNKVFQAFVQVSMRSVASVIFWSLYLYFLHSMHDSN
jgi:hypothetical protein